MLPHPWFSKRKHLASRDRVWFCYKRFFNHGVLGAEESSSLWRSAKDAGVRLNVQNDFQRLPELPPYDVHREGILLDVDCPHAALVLDKASFTRAFNHRHAWLLLHNSTFNSSFVEDTLSDVAILPDADLIWSSADIAVDLYRVKARHPLIVTILKLNRSWDLDDLAALWGKLPTTVARRKDLNNVYLKAATTITQPEHFKGWSDLTNRQIDTFPKLTYPLMMLCAEDLHFRYNMKQVDLYGVERNGSFDGLAGLLQRQEIEVGVTSMFMRGDRWRVLHYCSETVELRGAFIFRQPSQSAVSNVFLLPFSRGVWCAGCGVVAAAALLLAALRALTLPDAITFALGTVCQQGFHVTPNVTSVRLVMFFTMITSLFAFTAYSAKIVAILQTPSDAIQSIDDLTRSPMTLGVQETTYKNVYFAESRDPATQRLRRRKLAPLAERALSVLDGVARVRTGLFAFQVEQSAGYDIISKTFTESEKCGLQEIQAFKLPMVAVPLRRHSGYRELFAVRLRWQRETGTMCAWRRRWLAERARCAAAGAGFRSVGLADVLPALYVVCGGAALAALLLLAERTRFSAARSSTTNKHLSTLAKILPKYVTDIKRDSG